jgi:hypothetical protein
MLSSIFQVFQKHGIEQRRQAKKAYQADMKKLEEVERMVIDRIQQGQEKIAQRLQAKLQKPDLSDETN